MTISKRTCIAPSDVLQDNDNNNDEGDKDSKRTCISPSDVLQNQNSTGHESPARSLDIHFFSLENMRGVIMMKTLRVYCYENYDDDEKGGLWIADVFDFMLTVIGIFGSLMIRRLIRSIWR